MYFNPNALENTNRKIIQNTFIVGLKKENFISN